MLDSVERDPEETSPKSTPWFWPILRCPADGARLQREGGNLICLSCGTLHPVVRGRPVLIDEERSVFRREDFVEGADDAPGGERRSARFRSALRALLPTISANLKAERSYGLLSRLLAEADPQPLVLIIGAGDGGTGASPLTSRSSFRLLRSDVFIGPQVELVCDAHTLPFEDGSFDAVVVQAVLEHVLDPAQCVAEIHRVLKPHGLVFAETPFMQQVHMGAYDFTRYTVAGHRRLFRHFELVDDGACCGPGMALAWAWRYFLCSFTKRPLSYRIAAALAQLTSFWLVWFDRIFIDRAAAQDAASGVYFIGRRAEVPVTDREIVASYRGAIRR